MPVIRTDEWMKKEKPTEICERLVFYFENANARDIYLHLIHHGMHSLSHDVTKTIEEMKRKGIWERADAIYQELQKRWNGPDVPIFIFPADSRNRKLARDFNSKGGLAYSDKLFLFLLPHHQLKEIEAVLTHEYNHVCRLAKQPKKENTLLDAIVLEGLAEQAVGKYVGEAHQAKWINYYSEEELRKFWKQYLARYQSIRQSHSLHNRLLYGLGLYPPMLGYATGYGMVGAAMEEEGDILKLLAMPSERVLQLSRFDE
ncbi:DUF2268 domain-containing protein [Anoxybacteroides tepidamans]|uniref:DUF2268 domain-containing protein n=1 Tax=Anoxybacteroides tepidamans TaxID=265948 RepID=UPI000481F1DA|nr:DUF2268 domain-containing protein [Anoxybacillus tepidamans]